MRFDFPLEMQPKNARKKPKNRKAVKMYYAYYFMPNFIVSFYFMYDYVILLC